VVLVFLEDMSDQFGVGLGIWRNCSTICDVCSEFKAVTKVSFKLERQVRQELGSTVVEK
jgi:hypothetical protein